MNTHKFLVEKLNSKNYITSEKIYDENFYFDKIFDLFEIDEFKVGNRSKTELISDEELIKIINNKL